MIDLSDRCGLPIYFDPETLRLEAGSDEVVLPEPGVRKIDELRPVLMEPDCQGPEIVYFMYRDIHLRGQEHMRAERGLRYDISTFTGQMLGREYFKTYGHYHPYIQWRYPLSWPEVYEILYGRAIFLVQKVDDIYRDPFYIKVEDIIAIPAQEGDKVIMPPNYGHVTINPDPTRPLVMANWVCDWFSSYYESVKEARGFAYYYVQGDGGEPQWVPNRTYRQPLPELRHAKPLPAPEIGLEAGKPMYTAAIENPDKFEWVCRPQEWLAEIWSALEIE